MNILKLTVFSAAMFSMSAVAHAAEVRLKSLKVNSNLSAGVPYDVNIPLSLNGSIKDVEGCFSWSGEGPYCFAPLKMSSKNFYIKLRTGNPGTYELKGFLKFKDENGNAQSNAVTKTIKVK